MINDKQARTLLSECELWLNTKLDNLRERLRSDHVNTKPILWELIVLHAIASSIASRNNEKDENINQSQDIAPSIQHEPTEAAPDIFLQPDNCQPFYIEVAYIKPRNQQQEEDVKHFPRWVRRELSQRGIAYADSLGIDLDLAESDKDVQVPPRNEWNQQLKTDKWKLFVTELSSGKLPSIWVPEGSNVIVKVEETAQGFEGSSSFPAQNIPKQVEDNPIYKTIKSKAEQAKRWEKMEKLYRPLVLIIGATESLHQINNSSLLSSRQLQKTIYSALADTEQWDWNTILNYTDNRSWSWAMRSQRVSGSRLISAVVIVTVGSEYSGLGYRWLQKASKPLIVKNPHPATPLTAEQERFLGRIDFDQVKYGSGLENWEQSERNPNDPILNKQSRRLLLNKHLRESEGRFVFGASADHTFNVEIPCNLVARFLIGDITANDVWNVQPSSVKSELADSPSLEQTIGNYLKIAADIRQPIINVEFVQGDIQSRKESRIRLKFGTFATTSSYVKDCFRDSIELNADGTGSVTLSTSLVIGLLAGKLTTVEVWQGENRQEIGDFLRSAIRQGQEIIDSSFVQDSSESERESQVIFKFGAITDALIREDKKRLRELKKIKESKGTKRE